MADDDRGKGESARIAQWSRLAAIVVGASPIGFLVNALLGRLVPGASSLLTLPLCVTSGVVFGLVVAKRVSRRPMPATSPAWILLPVALVLPAGAALIVIQLIAHLALGSPAIDCEWADMDVERCVGRDWSFLQARHGYVVATGRVDVQACRRFQAGIRAQPKDPCDGDGWIRCPADDPASWFEMDCGLAGFADMERCYACMGKSATHDLFWDARGFSQDCSQAMAFYGANVHPTAAKRCSRSIRRGSCPSDSGTTAPSPCPHRVPTHGRD